ncbi:MAG: BamA/TamA family outer membrane protein [Flavobacteriales bacterium]
MCRPWQNYAICGLIALSACSPYKRLQQNERLLTKVEINIDNDEESDEAYWDVMRQIPNSRFLGIRVPMRLHLMISPEGLQKASERRRNQEKEEGGFRWWMANRMGEAPVIYDEEAFLRTSKNIERLAQKKGYLEAKCTGIVDSTDANQIQLIYDLALGAPWTIVEGKWDKDHCYINRKLEDSDLSVMNGMKFDVSGLDGLRSDLVSQFRNSGFPTIQESHLSFVADTSSHHAANSVSLELQILPRGWDEDGIPLPHFPVRFGNIDWHCDGDSSLRQSCLDEVMVEFLISIDSGMIFNERAMKDTYRRLAKVPSIGRLEIPGDINVNASGVAAYDMDIALHLRNRYGVTSSIDMVRSDARYGPIVSWMWQDNNVSGKGDVWGAKLSGGLASTSPFSYSSDNIIPNSGTWSVDVNYSTLGIPPLSWNRLRPSNQARTSVRASWVHESRPEYIRTGVGFSYGFDFIENPEMQSKFELTPLEFRYSDIEAKPDFESWLIDQANPVLSARFSDYTSLLSRAHWHSNWLAPNLRLQGRISANLEWTGMGMNWMQKRFSQSSDGPYTLGGIPYAQYVRCDIEWIASMKGPIASSASWHSRFKVGGAKTGANMEVIPFDRAFYAGGANGIRGWTSRELGPGFAEANVVSSEWVQGVGDVQIEGSIEYRRMMSEVLELAWFSDAGNVWVIPKSEGSGPVNFGLNSMAWSTGIGMRLDFEFFILRLDGAVRLFDPSKPTDNRWIEWNQQNGRFHLGIGHAF